MTYEGSVTYTYDAVSRLTQVVDSITGTIARDYDGLDHLVSETTPQGAVAYSYDAAGRRASLSVPGQPDVNYTFDEANRLTQINQNSSTVSFTFDSAGRRTTMTLPNGITATYSYDDASQLTGLSYATSSGPLGNLTYAYDMAGRRVGVGGTLAQTNLPSPVSVTAYNANNQLTTWGTANLFYDANGNMTSDGTNSFVWNARNKLASMNFTANSFQYDPFGRRQAKTISGTTTNYLYDGVNVAQELSGTTPTANLLSGGVDEVFTRTDSSGTANFVTDALGSTLALTNGSGSTVASYTYDPFGNTTQTGSSTDLEQYTGRENDGTGIYFYRARYYSPILGRFISEDPAEAGLNYYSFVDDDPVNRTDPSGLDWENSTSNFLAGAGDTLSFGLSAYARNQWGDFFYGSTPRVIDKCSLSYTGGIGAGIAITTVLGGALGAEAAEANAGEKGFEFSHWIPDRWGGPRSIFNGNFVSEQLHYLTDFSRFPAPAGAALRWGPKLNPLLQQIIRIPWIYDGAAAGTAYGGASAMAGKSCGCH